MQLIIKNAAPRVVKELITDMDWLYYDFLNNTRPVCDVINPIRSSSLNSVNLYQNRSLDFVFIDASHEYEDVKKDIDNYYNLLNNKGIIFGDDYYNFVGVQKAVTQY